MSYRDVVLADSPVAYFRLGEPSGTTIVDETGGANGTYVTPPTLGVTGALTGDADTAAEFVAASSQYGTVPNRTGFSLAATGALSIEAWVKRTASAVNQTIAQHGTSVPINKHDWWFFLTPAGRPSLQIWDYNGNNRNTIATFPAAIGTAWTHLVVTLDDATDTVVYYVDGVSTTDSGAWAGVSTASPAVLAIARRDFAADSYLNGSLDEVAIYNVALTSTQVAAHYTAGTTGGGGGGSGSLEIASLTAVLPGTEAGAGGESVSGRDLATTDAGAATDTASVDQGATAKTASDAAAGTDALASIGLSATAEAGAGTDAATVAAVLATRTDAGAATDTAVGIALGTVTDSGAATDTAAISVPVIAADSGVATETRTGLGIASGDAATATDAASLAAALATRTDAGAGTDAATVNQGGMVSATDAGAGTDTSAAPAVTLTATDAAAATDTATVQTEAVMVSASDSGTATESSTIAALYAAADTGAGAELAALTAGYVLTDSATGADTAGMAALVTALEVGSGADSAILTGGSPTRSTRLVSVPVQMSSVGVMASGARTVQPE